MKTHVLISTVLFALTIVQGDPMNLQSIFPSRFTSPKRRRQSRAGLKFCDILEPRLLLTTGFVDADGSGIADAFTDGILTIRHFSGFTGTSLVDDAVDDSALRPGATDIAEFLDDHLTSLDVDDDGRVTALTDGVTITRALAGMTGQSLVDDSVNPNGNRTDPGEILAYITQHFPGLFVAETSPADGEELVNVTRDVIVRFDGRVVPETVTEDSLYVIAMGQRVPGRVVVSPTERFATYIFDEPLPASTAVRIVVDGNRIQNQHGIRLDGDENGAAGGIRSADFSTLPLTRIPDTNVFGFVRDSLTGEPIVGATIRVDAFPEANAVTNENGRFELTDMPAPDFFVHIDGSTATNALTGFVYPNVGKPFHSVPGQTVQLEMDGEIFDIFLPPMAMDDIQDLSPDQTTAVGFGQSGRETLAQMFPNLDPVMFDQMRVNVQPGTAIADDGTAATEAVVIPVPPDRIPAPLPPLLDTRLVISIQAPGASSFAVPAEISFPNLDGLNAGEKMLIMSFNHDAGKWEPVGPATVSEDGMALVSDAGVGIRAPGWHAVVPQTETVSYESCGADEVCIRIFAQLGDVTKADLSDAIGNSEPGDHDFEISQPFDGIQTLDSTGTLFTTSTDEFASDATLYVVPNIAESSTHPATPAQGTVRNASGKIQLTLFHEGTEPGEETGCVDAGNESVRCDVLTRIDFGDTYSTSGDNAVTFGTEKLDIWRTQQRLRYLGYHNTEGNSSRLIETNGELDEATQHAIGVFNAAVRNSGHSDESTPDVAINNSAAPRWREIVLPTGITDVQRTPENYLTHWAQEVLDGAAVAGMQFIGASRQGGGDSPAHSSHEAGMDIDINLPDATNSGSLPWYGTIDVGGVLYVAANTADGHIVWRKPDGSYVGAAPDATMEDGSVRMEHTYDGVYNNRVVLQAIHDAGLFVRRYDADRTGTWIEAFRTLGTEMVGGILFNDPMFWTSQGVPVRFANSHGGHLHVDVQPRLAAASPAAGGGTANNSDSTASGFGSDNRIYYRIELENGVQVAGSINEDGTISTILPPEQNYSLSIYRPSTNESGVFFGRTNSAGEETNLGALIADEFGGTDSDGDRIPDIGEFVIGTLPDDVDSDGDGVNDDAELEQGLNPLDGRATSTGIIAALDLPGTAHALVMENELAVVATREHGLALIDTSRFANPILLGQLELDENTNGVAYDTQLNTAVLAADARVYLVDISDPMLPVLANEVAVEDATAVEIANGFAYVATGNSLTTIDIASGAFVGSPLNLSNDGVITDMARDGDTLFAFVSGSDTLHAVDLGVPDTPQLLSSIQEDIVPFDVGVFAADDVVWLAGLGLHTFDYSDAANPTGISEPDLRTAAARFALNGSGLGILATGTGVAELYDASDPVQTGNRLLQIAMTNDFTRDVVVDRGIAYLATSSLNGTSQFNVLNYLPFDDDGQPPTIAISTDNIDVDPSIDGIQVVEGSVIPVNVVVTDDVQVRNVELLVDGQVVRDDGSYPFEFFGFAPVLTASNTTAVIQARVTDTGGNVTVSDTVTVQLVADTFAPMISKMTPVDGATAEEGPLRIAIEFSEPIDLDAIDSGTFRLIEAGPNGIFGDADDSIVNKKTQFSFRDQLVRLQTEALPSGSYRIEINEPTVLDRAGNPLGDSLMVSQFTVAADTIPPTIVEFFPGDGEVLFFGEKNVSVRFSEAIQTSSIRPETFRIVEAGPNGSFGDNDDVFVDYDLNFQDGSTLAAIEANELPAANYRLEVDESDINDLSDNRLGDSVRVFEFFVTDQLG